MGLKHILFNNHARIIGPGKAHAPKYSPEPAQWKLGLGWLASWPLLVLLLVESKSFVSPESWIKTFIVIWKYWVGLNIREHCCLYQKKPCLVNFTMKRRYKYSLYNNSCSLLIISPSLELNRLVQRVDSQARSQKQESRLRQRRAFPTRRARKVPSTAAGWLDDSRCPTTPGLHPQPR